MSAAVSEITCGLLPKRLRSTAAKPVPEGLIGSKLVGFGGSKNPAESCLVVEFVPEGSRSIHQVVLDFNELGMWVKSEHVMKAQDLS